MDTNNFLKELSPSELIEVEGGFWEALAWAVGSYIVSEIIQGVYQAQQKGCI